MKEKLKIDIVSDVVCPWCTIGYKRLEKAILELGIKDQVEIEWQPFELNPNMPAEGQNVTEHIAEKYGSTIEQQKQSKQQMIDIGEELGFTFDYFEEMRMVNTFESHILLEYAKNFGKQTDLKMRLTTAFFSERKDVSKREILKQAQNSPIPVAEQVAIIYIGTNGFLDDLEISDISSFIKSLREYIISSKSEYLAIINSSKQLTPEAETILKDAISEVKKTFKI